jgi:hypothetical protein
MAIYPGSVALHIACHKCKFPERSRLQNMLHIMTLKKSLGFEAFLFPSPLLSSLPPYHNTSSSTTGSPALTVTLPVDVIEGSLNVIGSGSGSVDVRGRLYVDIDRKPWPLTLDRDSYPRLGF